MSQPPHRFDADQLGRFLKYQFDASAGAVEVRVLGAYQVTPARIEAGQRFATVLAGWYDDPRALVADAAKLRGISGYICFNPTKPDLLGRSYNRLSKCRSTTSDDDIVALRWLYADVDSVRASDTSATAEQRAAAHARLEKVLREHPDLAAASIFGSSGNGGWILARLPDYPNDDEHRRLVADVVASLAARYSDAVAKIDPPAKNASRIGPLVGTMKCKGSHIPGKQEWSLVTMVGAAVRPLPKDAADDPPLAVFDARAWLAANPAPERPEPRARSAWTPAPLAAHAPAVGGHAPGSVSSLFPRDEVLRRANAYVERLEPAVSGQNGHSQTFDMACALVKGFDLGLADAIPIAEAFNARCDPPWEPYDLHRKLLEADEKADDKPRGYLLGPPPPALGEAPVAGGPPESFSFSDMGNAQRFVARFGREVRFCKPYGDWLVYDGRRWRQDDKLTTDGLSQMIPGLVRAEIPPGSNPQTVAAYSDWALRSESKERLASALAVARSHVSVVPSELDSDPWLLNCLNGTINLKTREFRRHEARDLITKLAPVEYDPTAKCPRYDRFMEEVMEGNQRIIDFKDRYMGYSLTGDTRDQFIPLNLGSGGNGKDVEIELALQILGDYAAMADPDLLRATRDGKHPVGVHALRGRRYVAISESDEDVKVDESLLKRLTGTATTTARGMRENFSSFAREAKLHFFANHKPPLRGKDNGLWRRILTISWPIEFVDEADPDRPISPGSNRRVRDPNLIATLRAEAPGILARWVRACGDWQENGLQIPEEIRAATREYRRELDSVRRFVDEMCDTGTGIKSKGGDLYDIYLYWIQREHPEEQPPTPTKFGLELGRLGFLGKRECGNAWRFGLALRPPPPDPGIWTYG